MKSPCLDCEFWDWDKNHLRCVECERRYEYAKGEGMLPSLKAWENHKERPMKFNGRRKRMGSRHQVSVYFAPEEKEIYDRMTQYLALRMVQKSETVVRWIKEGLERESINVCKNP